jgi:TonB-linked SusC/RagA family outer membrane protein
MSRVWSCRLTAGLRLWSLALLLCATAVEGLAQGGVVAGTVIDARSLRGLDGVQVGVDGTSQAAITDASGRFRFTGLTGDRVTLQLRRIGYRPATQTARVGDEDLRITLTEAPAILNQVIVTGTAAPVEKRAIGNAVARIEASDVQSLAPAQDLTSLINGRAAGVVLTQGSGAIGAGPRIKIRGSASLSLSDQPLIYVDGIRVANDVSTGPRSQFFSSGIISRLNDIDPETIESLEIIKGPAAATLYGTEASNGVIQIITKQGKVGKPVFTLTTRQGTNWFHNAEGRIGTNYIRDPATQEIKSWNPVAYDRSQGLELFRTGYSQSYNLGLNGGTAQTRYNLSGSYDNDKGIEPTNRLWRWTGLANLAISPVRSLDINASLGINQQNINVPLEAGGGMWFSAYFGRFPLTDAERLRRGYFSAPPEAFWGAFQQYQRLNRTTGSLQLTHRLGEMLTQRLIVGNDLTGEDNVNETERMAPFYRQFFGNPVDQNGNKLTRRRELSVSSLDYSASLRARLLGVSSTTSFGAQYFKRSTYTLAARGEGFPAAGLSLVDAAAQTFGGEDFFENSTLGFYVQEQLNLNERVSLTGAVRVDDNSAFGENFSWIIYPKVAATWVINEEGWWKWDWANALKLRVAYGQTGQQPEVNSALRTYAAVTGGDGASAVTPQALGNADLKAERGSEIEIGFDGAFLNDRFGAELTLYRRDTKDAILLQDVAPSSGFPGQRFVNIGGIQSQGVELMTRANVLQRDNFNLDLTFNISHNDNEVTDLGGLPFIQIGANRNQIGLPVMSWFDFRVVKATFDPVTKRATGQICDDGKGGETPCLNAAGQAIAPRVFIGRADPSTEGSFSTTATLWRRLRLYGLLDWKGGHRILNNNDRARCQVFNMCLANLEPEKYDPVFVAQIQSPNILRHWIYQPGTYVKLREVSLGYTLSSELARYLRAASAQVTVSGRNLATWTQYGGTDPENYFTLQQFVRLEQAQVPPLQQFLVSLSLTF